MSQYLATIVRDVDIDFDFDKAKVDLPEVAVVTDFLKKMQFYTFIKNINEIMYSFDKINRNEPAYMPSDGSLQLGFFADAVNEEINKNSDFKFEKSLSLILQTYQRWLLNFKNIH